MKKPATAIHACSVLAALLCAAGVVAQAPDVDEETWSQHAELQSSAPALGADDFGYAVAIHGSVALVGAPWVQGVAVFERDDAGFHERAWLQAPHPGEGTVFGGALALSPDLIVVGAPGAPLGELRGVGAVHVFTRDGAAWRPLATLSPSVPLAEDHFGSSVAVSGDTVVVGMRPSPSRETPGVRAAHVFVRAGDAFVEQARLVAAGPPQEDAFAVSVAVAGDSVFVGAPIAEQGRGVVHAFVRSHGVFSEGVQLRGADQPTGERFGFSLAASADTLLVGAPGSGLHGQRAGAAYVFVRSGEVFGPPVIIGASSPQPEDRFGLAVALSGDHAIIADFPYGEQVDRGRSAHIFVRSSAEWVARGITPARSPARFGAGAILPAVAISGQVALVGAPRDHGGDGGNRVLVFAPGPAPAAVVVDAVTPGQAPPPVTPTHRPGCGCRVGAPGHGARGLLLLGLVLGVRGVRRKRQWLRRAVRAH